MFLGSIFFLGRSDYTSLDTGSPSRDTLSGGLSRGRRRRRDFDTSCTLDQKWLPSWHRVHFAFDELINKGKSDFKQYFKLIKTDICFEVKTYLFHCQTASKIFLEKAATNLTCFSFKNRKMCSGSHPSVFCLSIINFRGLFYLLIFDAVSFHSFFIADQLTSAAKYTLIKTT